MKIITHQITATDDLAKLVAEINAASWDEGNDIGEYAVDALRAYLAMQHTVFISCHLETNNGLELAGMGSACLELKPYEHFKWLYVDEIDVCSNHRQKGVGTALMNALLTFAKSNGCEELWLATEKTNVAANALYRSLDPDDIDDVIGYNFELD